MTRGGLALGLAAGGLVLTACGSSPAPAGSDGSTTSISVGRTLAVSTPTAAANGPGTSGSSSRAVGSAPPAGVASTATSQRVSFEPTKIQLLSAADATAPVVSTDTLPNGELQIPAQPATIGWWRSGALAGDLFGGVVLVGHIDSAQYGLGYFAKLLNIRPGNEIELSNTQYEQKYRVQTTKEIAKTALATSTDIFSQDVPGRLILLTCTGKFDRKTGHYDHNLVVIATPTGNATTLK